MVVHLSLPRYSKPLAILLMDRKWILDISKAVPVGIIAAVLSYYIPGGFGHNSIIQSPIYGLLFGYMALISFHRKRLRKEKNSTGST